MPYSRPMPAVGPQCHEPRMADAGVICRIMYRADSDAVITAEVFCKKTTTSLRHNAAVRHHHMPEATAGMR
jgi:phage-related protein